MNIELTVEERNQLFACIDSAIKSAPILQSIQVAALLMPIVKKLTEATDAGDAST